MLRSSFIVAILSLTGSLVSFLNQLVIARLFGASIHMDAYLIAISVPMLVTGTLTSVLSYSMVPVLITYKLEPTEYAEFSSLMFICLAGFSILIGLAGYVTTPLTIAVLGVNLPPQVRSEAILMSRISWVSGGVAVIVGYLGSMHNASKSFFVPLVAGILSCALMTIFCLIFGRAWGPVAITWGLLAGLALAIPILLTHKLCKLNISKSCFKFRKTAVGYFSQAPLVVLALFCFTVYQFIDAYWAPRLGPGNLAYLGYCQRILVGLGTLIVAGPSAVLMPHLSEAFVEGRHQELLVDTARAVRIVVIIAAPFALIFSILAVPVIELLFERGAFDVHATDGVSMVLPFMMVGMVAMLCVVIIFRALFAKGAILSAAFLGVSCTTAYFILAGVFSFLFGLRGIGIAYSLSWWLIMFLSLHILWRADTGRLFSEENYKFIYQLAISLLVAGLPVFLGASFFVKPLSDVGFFGLALRICVFFGIGIVGFYLTAARVFRMPDIRVVGDLLENFLARRSRNNSRTDVISR